jgi:D-arabinose 1-dehydrogenase-like Zn-dependent alcohol dehydrogenase
LGHIALQWAAAMGCREIVAISGRDNKKDEAFRLGATKFIKYVPFCALRYVSCMIKLTTYTTYPLYHYLCLTLHVS